MSPIYNQRSTWPPWCDLKQHSNPGFFFEIRIRNITFGWFQTGEWSEQGVPWQVDPDQGVPHWEEQPAAVQAAEGSHWPEDCSLHQRQVLPSVNTTRCTTLNSASQPLALNWFLADRMCSTIWWCLCRTLWSISSRIYLWRRAGRCFRRSSR